MIRFLVLAGYFELTIYLHLSGKLNQYINMHYSYLAYISMVLSQYVAPAYAVELFENTTAGTGYLLGKHHHRQLWVAAPQGHARL